MHLKINFSLRSTFTHIHTYVAYYNIESPHILYLTCSGCCCNFSFGVGMMQNLVKEQSNQPLNLESEYDYVTCTCVCKPPGVDHFLQRLRAGWSEETDRIKKVSTDVRNLLLLPNSCSSCMREEASMSDKQVQSCGRSFHTNLWPRIVVWVPKNCMPPTALAFW